MNNMEVDNNFVSDKTILPTLYKDFKSLMQTLFEENLYSELEKRVPYNLETIGTIVNTLCYNANLVDPTMHLGGRLDTKYYKIEVKEVELEDKTKVLAFGKIEINLKFTIAQAKIKAMKLGEPEKRKIWFPFLASLQLCNKTTETIIYQKNVVTNNLGVPSICEPFANGYQIRDKFKKSRRMSIGPLVHLNSIVNLQERFRTGSKGSRKGKSTLGRDIYDKIIRDTTVVLKKQSISMAQRKIIDQIARGEHEFLSTLCVSYLSIKPHIEHNFVLTYALMYHTGNFENANFTGKWVYIKLREAIRHLIVVGQSIPWCQFLVECQIHSVFQSIHEDLRVLNKMFGTRFHQRKSMGSFEPNTFNNYQQGIVLDISFWAKPQKGAPRNIETVRSGQIVSRPSFRGKRATFNKFTTIEEVESSFLAEDAHSVKEALEIDFQKYKALETEGTGDFFRFDDDSVVEVKLEGEPILLFSQ